MRVTSLFFMFRLVSSMSPNVAIGIYLQTRSKVALNSEMFHNGDGGHINYNHMIDLDGFGDLDDLRQLGQC